MSDAASSSSSPEGVERSTAPTIGLIWAQSRGGIIGRDGVMPWHLPEDLAHFKEVTLGSPVVMGRRTWDSLPERFRPLPGRRNVVVTRQADWAAAGVETAHSVHAALALAAASDPEKIWVIGGASIYAALLDTADVIELTEIDADYDGDTSAPELTAAWQPSASDPAEGWHTSRVGLHYRFIRYTRP